MNIQWMKYRFIYFGLSLTVIAIGVYSLISWGLPLSIDFKGGTIAEYKVDAPVPQETLTQKLGEKGIEVSSIQQTGDQSVIIRLPALSEEKRNDIRVTIQELTQKDPEEIMFETVGPTIGSELVTKTIVAMLISAGLILAWVAYQFKSVSFGSCAIIAMLHDTFILIGLFALFGKTSGAQVDFLFVTALLTTLSFSVHDTIVVYDRIREIRRKHGGSLKDVANQAVKETMRRSINNSLTVVFMLLSLVTLGGNTIHWFAVALLIGTISGTYSSPFVAVPLLVTWEEVRKYIKRHARK